MSMDKDTRSYVESELDRMMDEDAEDFAEAEWDMIVLGKDTTWRNQRHAELSAQRIERDNAR